MAEVGTSSSVFADSGSEREERERDTTFEEEVGEKKVSAIKILRVLGFGQCTTYLHP